MSYLGGKRVVQVLDSAYPHVETGIFLTCQICRREEKFDALHSTQNSTVVEHFRSRGWKCHDDGRGARCPLCTILKKFSVGAIAKSLWLNHGFDPDIAWLAAYYQKIGRPPRITSFQSIAFLQKSKHMPEIKAKDAAFLLKAYNNKMRISL